MSVTKRSMARTFAGAVVAPLAAGVLGSHEHGPPSARAASGGGWTTLSPSPFAQAEVGAAIVGDQLYVVGGFGANGLSTAQMARYDIAKRRWKKVRRLPIVVNHPGVTAHRGHLYLLGGWTHDGRPSDHLYRYEPERNRWKRLPDAPTARAALALVGIGGRLYAAGGATAKTGAFRRLEIFDLKHRRWRKGPPMPTGRNHVGAAVFKRGLVVTGGRTDTGTEEAKPDLDVVERYDPGRRRWNRLPSLTVPRSGHAAATLPGTVAVFGGEQLLQVTVARVRRRSRDLGQVKTIADAEVLDPRLGRWSTLPAMPTARHGLGGAAFHRTVFAAAGSPQPGTFPAGILEALRVPP
jgi:N-acetylneuraminic acid mutarotase